MPKNITIDEIIETLKELKINHEEEKKIREKLLKKKEKNTKVN